MTVITKEAPPRVEGRTFDPETIRSDFPILSREVHGKPLVYLDNAATSQKPAVVIEALENYYRELNSNVHRGVHLLSQKATDAYEGARETLRAFINARSLAEVIYVRGTTEAINLVASTYGRRNVGEGDEVVITAMEHHSNIVPWQLLCEDKGARLRVAPMDDTGTLQLPELEKLLGPRTRLLSLGHVSNALGTINPLRQIIDMAHDRNIPVMVDGAQAVPHLAVDVQALDCDFYAFSSHKLYGPTGIGVLYGKEALLKEMPPYQGGGDMILSVSFEKTTYNALPYRFEAGTPNIADAIAFGKAVEYFQEQMASGLLEYEEQLLDYATEQVGALPGVRIIGTACEKVGVVSFVLDCAHPHDIGTIVDQEGVAIRTGHHCAQPVMERFQIPATARASFGMYNTRADVDALVRSLHKVIEVFG